MAKNYLAARDCSKSERDDVVSLLIRLPRSCEASLRFSEFLTRQHAENILIFISLDRTCFLDSVS